jgi:hypothetical protein
LNKLGRLKPAAIPCPPAHVSSGSPRERLAEIMEAEIDGALLSVKVMEAKSPLIHEILSRARLPVELKQYRAEYPPCPEMEMAGESTLNGRWSQPLAPFCTRQTRALGVDAGQ